MNLLIWFFVFLAFLVAASWISLRIQDAVKRCMGGPVDPPPNHLNCRCSVMWITGEGFPSPSGRDHCREHYFDMDDLDSTAGALAWEGIWGGNPPVSGWIYTYQNGRVEAVSKPRGKL